MLNVPQIANVQDKNIADALQRIVNHVNKGSILLGLDPAGTFPAPKAPAAISVVGGEGALDIQVIDESVVGNPLPELLTYWVEYTTDPNFINPPPYQVAVLAARNIHLKVPAAKLYVRIYSQKFGSLPSAPVVFGGTAGATQVDCTTGTISVLQGAQGSGSNPPTRPGGGYGRNPRFAG